MHPPKTESLQKNTWSIFHISWNPLPCKVQYYDCRVDEATSPKGRKPVWKISWRKCNLLVILIIILYEQKNWTFGRYTIVDSKKILNIWKVHLTQPPKHKKVQKNTWIIFLFTWNPLPCDVPYYHCRMHEAMNQEKGVLCPYEPAMGKNFE